MTSLVRLQVGTDSLKPPLQLNIKTMNMDRLLKEPIKGRRLHLIEGKAKMGAKTSQVVKAARRGLPQEDITRAKVKETDPEIDHSQEAKAHPETAELDPPLIAGGCQMSKSQPLREGIT